MIAKTGKTGVSYPVLGYSIGYYAVSANRQALPIMVLWPDWLGLTLLNSGKEPAP